MLQAVKSQRVRHDLATEQQQQFYTSCRIFSFCFDGILKETAENMYIAVGSMDVLTILILPVNKYEICSFNLF